MKTFVGVFGVVSIASLAWSGGDVNTAPSSEAWRMPEEYREIQRITVNTQRDLLTRMIDSIPESLLRRSVHVGRRDFAQQTHHAAVSVADALARVLQIQPPVWADTSEVFASRDNLRAVVNVAFDFIDSVLTTQSLDERNGMVPFGSREVYGWQLFDEINEHTLWTAGQMVGNFRDANMTPPVFKFF